MGWETSNRRDGLPRWWPVTVRRILKRDPLCRCPGCIKCSRPRARQVPKWYWEGNCEHPSQEADHIGDPADHRDEVLRGKCRPCHGHKSSKEGLAAREGKKKPTGFFDEPHPGRLF